METIEQKYEPYNFSKTSCYVFILTIDKGGYFKIEHKVPSYIRKLKGVFITTSGHVNTLTYSGIISLNFNGQATKCFQMAVSKTDTLEDCSLPIPFDERINLNSFVQGYFYAIPAENEFPYTLSIYLHYKR